MLPDKPVPLADDSTGVALETRPRHIQNGSRVYHVSLNRDWLSQLGICVQGAATLHSFTTRPVVVQEPALIIQPAEVLDR
ncbi:MAG: hypothetical protein ACOCTH_01370 [Halodesulfurarchaeum sp.]